MQIAIVRLIVLVVLLLNQTLITLGWSPIPFSEEQVFEAISSIALVVTAIYTWWKNNDTTREAERGTELMHELKENKKKPLL